mmetsp:Transcript_85990/g.221396  ORF Transcript_85990/g.221396 Transcript_85990/m.221396 type:complete len:272 (-) Transcript_85990:71-886(-)
MERPAYLDTSSGTADSSPSRRFGRSTAGSGEWQRSFSAADVVGMIREPHMRRRPFDHRGMPEEILSQKEKEAFMLTAPVSPDPGNKVRHKRFMERQLSNPSFSYSDGGTPMSTSFGPAGDLSPISATTSKARTPANATISPMSTKGERSLRSTKRSKPPEVQPEDRALDFWPLGHGSRIMHHIEPKKSRPISLTGDIYQGFPRQDFSEVDHLVASRCRYPAGRDQMQASPGPFPQGRSAEELRRNRNFDRSHGSMPLAHGMMRVGAQVMFL